MWMDAATFNHILDFHSRNILAVVSSMLADRDNKPYPEGYINPKSYDPTDGTVAVTIGPTMSLIPDGTSSPTEVRRLPLYTTQLGDVYLPVGGERVSIIGDGCIISHGPDDAPGNAQSGLQYGERFIGHYNAEGDIDAYRHFTNDGPTAGDTLGGVRDVSGAFHSTATRDGLSQTLDDTTEQIVHTAGTVSQTLDKGANKLTHKAGPVYTLFDGNGNAISQVASTVAVGDLWANLDNEHAAYRNSDMQTFAANVKTMVGNLAQQLAQAAATSGVTNAAAWLASIKAGLPNLSFVDISSSVPMLSVPTGSSSVRIKS